MAATGVGPKADIDSVLCGGDGGRKSGATHMGKQSRRDAWTIMDLHRDRHMVSVKLCDFKYYAQALQHKWP